MITPPNDYPSRTHDYVAGDQVTSSDLNDIQDAIKALSDSVDELAAEKLESRTASENQSDSPAPELASGLSVWVEKSTNGTNVVVLDDFVDWRQRFVHVVGYYTSLAGYIPGGANDDAIAYNLQTAGIHRFFYSEAGQTGGFGNPGISIDIGTEFVRIFARNTDGALCMRKDAHAADPDFYIVAKFEGSPDQNH